MAQPNLKPICASCESAKKCSFVQTTGELLLECNAQRGFEGLYLATNGGRSTEGAGSRMTLISGREVLRAVAQDDCEGLCVNCEERSSCSFPKPPGGVWHCEEYR